MKTVYIDNDFKVYTQDDGNRRAVTTDLFDGKCSAWIQGHRLVPAGETWVREDGEIFQGTMCTPWRPFHLLDAAQRDYERLLILDMQQALSTMGVTPDE